jgi:hypothetical protein
VILARILAPFAIHSGLFDATKTFAQNTIYGIFV